MNEQQGERRMTNNENEEIVVCVSFMIAGR